MIYNSFNFILLFPILFLPYYLIPAKLQKLRNLFLLIVSYLLYLNWKPIYALILLGITVATFLFARRMEKHCNQKILVCLGGAISILPLLFFKYFNFIDQQLFQLMSFVSLRYELHGLNWAIPRGISFFTFQALGYLFDVYYKRIEAEKDF